MVNTSGRYRSSHTLHERVSVLPPPFVMALLVTIFLLVLVSQVISWIGSSVLQEFVSELVGSVWHN